MFLADMSNHPPIQSFFMTRRWIGHLLSPILIVIGLFIASYPADKAETVGWSAQLHKIHGIFPPGSFLPKRYTALGVDTCIVAIFISPALRELLSTRVFLWLGKVSFAVYLTHGTLLRTVLTWMLYGTISTATEPPKNEKGEPIWLQRRPWPVMAISIPVWLCLVYTIAYLWTVHVDGWCARLTAKLEQKVFEDTEREKSAPLLPQ